MLNSDKPEQAEAEFEEYFREEEENIMRQYADQQYEKYLTSVTEE